MSLYDDDVDLHGRNSLSSSNGFNDGSYDSCDLSTMTDQSLPPQSGLIYTYEVRFKTCVEQYLFHEKLDIGEMVTVQCERGYNIGFVDGEALPDPDNPPQKRILAKLIDEDNTIKEMLKFKITAEKNALAQCRLHCKGHRLGSFADSIAAEFQFDRKKLTVYLKKYEDVSVCRLVRKLYDTYKMRIKVLEVETPESMKEMTKKYLELSKLSIPLSDAFNYDPVTSVLSSKNQAKQNKSDKHAPNYSKSHLGQSQHLIPSLVQYGPQADKRHNQQPVYHQTYFPNAPITSNLSQTKRADRNYDNYHSYGYGHGQVAYEQPQHHNSAPAHYSYHNAPRNSYPTQGPPLSWSSTNMNQRGLPSMDRQVDKPSFQGVQYHHQFEPLGHDGSVDESAYRYPQSNLSSSYSGNYNDTYFGEQEDSLCLSSRLEGCYQRTHPSLDYPGLDYEINAVPNDIEVLSSALSRPLMGKGNSNSSLSSSNLSSPTNSITSTTANTQMAQSVFRYPEVSF